MTSDEMRDLLGFVTSNWNIRGMSKFEGESMAKVWTELLGNYDYEVVMNELRTYAFESPYQPRPADIARRTVDALIRLEGGTPPPPVRVAVEQAEARVRQVNLGIGGTDLDVDDLVADVMRELRTKYTRDSFQELYTRKVAEFYASY